jgi:hypothetical protein
MRKAILWLAIVGLITFLPAAAQDVQRADRPQDVILIGWDGAHRDHVKALLKEDKLPNLRKLIAEGTMVDIDVMEVTDTKAGWSQILTGYKAAVTGVYSNGRYQSIPKGYSIFERLREFFGTDKVATVATIGKKGHVDNDPPKKVPLKEWEDRQAKAKAAAAAKPDSPLAKRLKADAGGKMVEENGQKFWVIPGKPHFNASQNMDVWINGLMLDDKVGDKALEMLDKYKDKPFFFFVHFAEVDHKGHKSGEKSKEYDDAIISGDKQLGRIVEKLKELKLYEKTLIYVTADHGFDVDKKGHGYAPFVFLATNDKKVTRDGTRADITPTILDRFGLDLGKIEPKLDGETLTKPSLLPPQKAPTTKPAGAGKKGAGKRLTATSKAAAP